MPSLFNQFNANSRQTYKGMFLLFSCKSFFFLKSHVDLFKLYAAL